MESLFSAFCRDKGIPEWQFFNYLCWRRGRKKRKQAREDGKAGGKEGNGGMREQKKDDFFCLEHWESTPLSDEFSLPDFPGQIPKPTWIFSGACKGSPLNLLGATHRSTSRPALARVAEGCAPLPWLRSLSRGLWNNPWGALLEICSPLLKATNKHFLKYSEQYLHKYSLPWLED